MTGILVAAWIPGETGKQIALANGEPVSQMHITLLYYPDAPIEDVPGIVAAVAPVAFRSAPLLGTITGRGRFYGDEQDVIYAVPSLDGLAELRGELQEALREAGYIESTKHGWNPHITLKYIESDEPSPFSEYSDSDRERLLSFVTKKDGCWLWTGAKNAKGYGIFKVNGKAMRAHRVSYEMAHGKIAAGAQILHDPAVCNNTSCINPRHLREGSNEENVRDRYGLKTASEGERIIPLEIGSIDVRFGDEYRITIPFAGTGLRQFMAPGQPRDNLGKWTKGGTTAFMNATTSLPPPAKGLRGSGPIKDSLWTQSELDSVRLYRGSGGPMNAQLRGTEYHRDYNAKLSGDDRVIDGSTTVGEQGAAMTKAFDSIAARTVMTQDVEVYRGGAFATVKPGQTFTDKGFASTSANKEVGERFAKNIKPTGDQVPTVFTMTIPKGTKVVPIGGEWEAEIVLNRGTTFKVNAVSMVGKVQHVNLEIVS